MWCYIMCIVTVVCRVAPYDVLYAILSVLKVISASSVEKLIAAS